jgi:hypothetical protein
MRDIFGNKEKTFLIKKFTCSGEFATCVTSTNLGAIVYAIESSSSKIGSQHLAKLDQIYFCFKIWVDRWYIKLKKTKTNFLMDIGLELGLVEMFDKVF